MRFSAGEKIVFIGDSITDAGRRQDAPPYGTGYVSLVRAAMLARYPQLELGIVNAGIGGNTARDLHARWETDALAEKPHWLSVKIGINDVWRAFANRPDEAVPLDEYTNTLRALLTRATSGGGTRLILMTPYLIEANRDDPMRRTMEQYGAAVKGLAVEFDAVCVDTQGAFDTVLAHTPALFWADDRIHPGLPGHAVLALAWLRAVGFAL